MKHYNLMTQQELMAQRDTLASRLADAMEAGSVPRPGEILHCKYIRLEPNELTAKCPATPGLLRDYLAMATTAGPFRSLAPWTRGTKLICPAPGYARHADLCREFGLEPVSLRLERPQDVEALSVLVRDEGVKGIWYTPKMDSAMGLTFTDGILAQIAALKPAAPGFKVLIHSIYPLSQDNRAAAAAQVLRLFSAAGNADAPVIFLGDGTQSYLAASRGSITHTARQYLKPAEASDFGALQTLADNRALAGQTGMELLRDCLGHLYAMGAGSYIVSGGRATYIAAAGCAGKIAALCAQAGIQGIGVVKNEPGGCFMRFDPHLATVWGPALETFSVIARLVTAEQLLASRTIGEEIRHG